MIDPEALLLFSLPIARHDPRLFDEILDWLHQNGALMSLQRLQTLAKEYRLGDLSLLRPIAEKLATSSQHAKWRMLEKMGVPDTAGKEPQPLFEGIPVFGEPDRNFLRWGWSRGPIELRGMSHAPRPDQPATFFFKLRSLFGRQVRAEVMAWLLSHEHGHPTEIARQTGYFARSVQLVLNELEASGLIRSFRIGREKQFSLLHAQWRFLANWSPEGEFPIWIAWAPLFQVLQTFLGCLSQPGLDERSERFQAIQLREALTDSMPALAQAGVAHRLHSSPQLAGGALISALMTDIETLLGYLHAEARRQRDIEIGA
jgi:DNA-binding MarR family transcriptional regulator